ncbi:MAG TPA: polysaccharide deacetylase family protein [Longimicrobiales bacterium]|nr:polysaccharide deacetylase family protein [Longimicrobiales bacterium]
MENFEVSRPGRAPAVVIGLDSSTGLQSARILARHGIPVIGVASDRSHPCCRTNVCARIVTTEPGESGLIRTLERLGPELARNATTSDAAVLFPCADATVLLISRNRSRLLPWFRYALPDEEVVELLADKERFYRYAQREGLPIPDTRFLKSREDALEAGRTLRFPCVVKPPVKTPEWRSLARAKAFVARSAAELIELFDALSTSRRCLIAQALIEGPDREHYTCNCYLDEASRPLVTFVSRKLRQWPPDVGEGCLSVEARNDTVLDATVSLFRNLGHHGLGYLEMKRNGETGEYLIIEPNVGRPTGRSSNAEAAGVELLHTQYCELLGRPLPASREQQYRGVKWVHTRRDVQSALHRINRGELTVRGWLDSWRGPLFHALFSWRDSRPFFADFVRAGRGLLKRGASHGPSLRPPPVSKEAGDGHRHGPVGLRLARPRARKGSGAPVRILTYHRVIDPGHPSVGHPGLVSATPAAFERQMRYLERYYDVVSVPRVLDALQGGSPLPARPVLITFDDAYVDFGEVAWPILRARGLSATLFVPTAFPDAPEREFWWDRIHRAVLSTRCDELVETPLGRLDLRPEQRRAALRVLERWLKTLTHDDALAWIDAVCQELGVTEIRPAPVLGWDALRRLAAEGVTLAPHTRTHPALDRMPLAAAQAEIRDSREDLDREIGSSAPIFAYPFGARDERVVTILKMERFEAAVTQRDGSNSFPIVDRFGLRRTNITRRTSPIALALRLTSVGAHLDAWRRAYPRLDRWCFPAPSGSYLAPQGPRREPSS